MKPKIEWKNYINNNKYSECQLITALNACYYLSGKYIKQDSKRYEYLVDFAKARNGSAIGIEKVWRKLGIKIVWEGNSLMDWRLEKGKPLPPLPPIEEIKKGTATYEWSEMCGVPLPLEYNVWHHRYGFHSTLIVDYEPKSDAIRVTNFDRETTANGWMFREDMYKYAKGCGQKKIYRLFGLI